MAWRLATSLSVLRSQINTKWPNRSKVSDGTIGDAAHSSRKSDHNPDSKGRVCAFDITRDPVNGPDLSKLIPIFLADSRTRYVIYNSKIYNPQIQNGAARPYSGSNAHKQHLHLSVTQAGADDARPWAINGPIVTTEPVAPHPARATLKINRTGGDVPVLQKALNENGAKPPLKVDGHFGSKTLAAVRAFQKATGLKVDGVVGPITWAKLASAVNSEAPKPPIENKPSTNSPEYALKLYQDLGWSKIQAAALVASLIWESGGNQDNPDTIRFEAIGDSGNSIGAGQWNVSGGRQQLLHDFAARRGKDWKDPETQLLYLDHELHTTERKAGTLLRSATTLEAAMQAAIQVWRPGTPHTERRLAIARQLLA